MNRPHPLGLTDHPSWEAVRARMDWLSDYHDSQRQIDAQEVDAIGRVVMGGLVIILGAAALITGALASGAPL